MKAKTLPLLLPLIVHLKTFRTMKWLVRISVFLILFFLGLNFNPLAAQPGKARRNIESVENNLIPFVPVKGFVGWNIHERMKHYHVQGVSIAVIKDFKIDWAKGYGLADTAKKMPVTTETVFSAGSISKLVMTAAAMRLVQQGKLTLDEPINNYLASWKIKENEFTQKKPITLRMLLSHTAGTSQASYWGFTPDRKTLPTIVEILSGAPMSESRPVVVNSEPGKEFKYSGGGFMVAQMAIMDVAKTDFATFAQQTVFDPLGMGNSTFVQPLPAEFQKKASWGYSSASWYKGVPYVYPQQAAAGLHTTATDLAKFIIAIQQSYRGKSGLLNSSLAKQMLAPQVAISDGGYKEQMALGAFLLERTDNKNAKGKYFEHQGANAGFISYAMGSVEGGNGVVVMLNSGDDFNGLGKEIRRAVAKTYNWHNFLPEEITPLELNAEVLDNYTGRYRRGADEVVYLRREKDWFIENINEGPDIYCFPVAKDTVVLTDYNIKGFFVTDKSGRAVSLQTVYQDKPMPRMRDDEFTPSEHLKAKRYAEAKAGFRQMNMNEYQITYLAYELFNKKPSDLNAVKAVLELALEQHPKSAIVHSRWGDYHLQRNDQASAIGYYEKALELDPADSQTRETLKRLAK